jgi:hypothetical protein
MEIGKKDVPVQRNSGSKKYGILRAAIHLEISRYFLARLATAKSRESKNHSSASEADVSCITVTQAIPAAGVDFMKVAHGDKNRVR